MHKSVFNSSRYRKVFKKGKKKRYAENFRISFFCYFVAIKPSLVSCEQEPIMPVICVDFKHSS